MPRCNINLAKGIIWPRWKRLLAYRALIVYFFVMALLLILMAARAVLKIYDGAQYYSQSRKLQQKFARLHPKGTDLLEHADELKVSSNRMPPALNPSTTRYRPPYTHRSPLSSFWPISPTKPCSISSHSLRKRKKIQ